MLDYALSYQCDEVGNCAQEIRDSTTHHYSHDDKDELIKIGATSVRK